MAKAGRIQHWKHGWIPVSPEAKAFVAHKGPRPASAAVRAKLPKRGDPDWSPNNEFGMRSRKVADRADEAKLRAQDIEDLVPGIDVQPHLQFASQDIPAHHTGGVVIDGHDVDKLLEGLASSHEGTATRLDTAEAAGLASAGRMRTLSTNTAKGSPEEQAIRRARRLKQALGLARTPAAHYEKVDPDATFGGRLVASGYTGGLVFDPTAADDLIRRLSDRISGTVTRGQARRAAGLGGF